MTEQTRAVFENPELLREKLAIFLRTPEKVEIYAKAAEKFLMLVVDKSSNTPALGLGGDFLDHLEELGFFFIGNSMGYFL